MVDVDASIVAKYDDISVAFVELSSILICVLVVKSAPLVLTSLMLPDPGSASVSLESKLYSKDAPPKFPLSPFTP